MTDMTYDPYKGVASEKERQIIYKNLCTQHEVELQEYERKKKVYDDFSTVWDKQRDIQLETEQRFHKNILMLSAGSFGVSFAFINQVVPLNEAFHTPILVLAWLLFGLSIVFAMLESRVSSFIQDSLLNDIEKNIELGYDKKPYKNINKRLVMLPTRVLNWVALGLFIVGVLCLMCFVYLNMVVRV